MDADVVYDLTRYKNYEVFGDAWTAVFIAENSSVKILLNDDGHRVFRDALGFTCSLLSGKCLFICDILERNRYHFNDNLRTVLESIEAMANKWPATDRQEQIRRVVDYAHDIVYDGIPIFSRLQDKRARDLLVCGRVLSRLVKTVMGNIKKMWQWEIPARMLPFFNDIILTPFCRVLGGDLMSILMIMFYGARLDLYPEAEMSAIFNGLAQYVPDVDLSCETLAVLGHLQSQVDAYIARHALPLESSSDEDTSPVL